MTCLALPTFLTIRFCLEMFYTKMNGYLPEGDDLIGFAMIYLENTSSTRTSRGRKFPVYKKKHKPIRNK